MDDHGNQNANLEPDPATQVDANADDTGTGGATQPQSVDPAGGQQVIDYESKYKDLERDYTRKAQELARLKRVPQQPVQQPPQEVPVSSEDFFTDPVGSTSKVVRDVFQDFEARQEQRRQLDEYVRSYAEENDIPLREMQRLNQRLQDAATDPDSLMELLVSVHRAENVGTELERAKQTVQDTAERNARAVTSEGGTPSQPVVQGDVPADFRTWPVDKRREYLAKTLGVNEFGA